MNINAAIKTVTAAAKIGGKWCVKHLPTILTALGTVGVVVGTIETARKAPEAKKELDEVKAEWEAREDKEKGSKADYIFKRIRIGAKYYWVVFLVIGGSIVCFWVAHWIDLKRLLAALAGLKIASDQNEKMEEWIRKNGGEKDVAKMRDDINSEEIKKHPVDVDTSKINHLIGECPVWDPITRHWMISSADRIRRARRLAVEELCDQLSDGSNYAFVPYSDFLEWCGMDVLEPHHTQDEAGQYLGFAVEAINGVKSTKLEEMAEDAVGVDWTAELKDGETPVLALRYDNPPRYSMWME